MPDITSCFVLKQTLREDRRSFGVKNVFELEYQNRFPKTQNKALMYIHTDSFKPPKVFPISAETQSAQLPLIRQWEDGLEHSSGINLKATVLNSLQEQ